MGEDLALAQARIWLGPEPDPIFRRDDRMAFWESKLGASLGVLLVAWCVVVGVTVLRVQQVTHPPRESGQGIDFESMLLKVQAIKFAATDGVTLAGWMLDAEGGLPPLVLCHDAGSSKASLAGLAIELNRRGFPVLLFDFRGHGESEGGGSTLGIAEKRDVLGAIGWLTRHRGEGEPVGLYGVGMGAHAAVLAAADRPLVRVLVLDALYPDVSYRLARGVFAGWKPGARHLSFLADGIFGLLRHTPAGEERAADEIGRLVGRDLLLLAPAGDLDLVSEMQQMVALVPNQRDADGSLVVLPATATGGLYGDDAGRHRQEVASFFEARLPSAARGPLAARAAHAPSL